MCLGAGKVGGYIADVDRNDEGRAEWYSCETSLESGMEVKPSCLCLCFLMLSCWRNRNLRSAE